MDLEFLLDLFVGEMLEYFGRILRADRAYDYRRFLCACKCLHIYPSFKLSMLSVATSHHRTYELCNNIGICVREFLDLFLEYRTL